MTKPRASQSKAIQKPQEHFIKKQKQNVQFWKAECSLFFVFIKK